jgi:hypothetical protein
MKKVMTDNRMLWVRNLEWLAAATKPDIIECELGSEVEISGLLNLADGAILCAASTDEPDQAGLYKYLLKIKSASRPPLPPTSSTKGYVFKDGLLGELVALLSGFLEARFYILSVSWRSLTPSSLPRKREYSPLRRASNEGIDPVVFGKRERHFAQSLPDFLGRVGSVESKYHQRIITGFHHYARALREIAVDQEMVFIRLVSAVEAVAVDEVVTDDIFRDRSLEDLVKELPRAEREELVKIFEVRKTKARFVTFLERNSNGFFKGGVKAQSTKIKKSQLPSICKAVYNARSAYLHRGEPMFLSQPLRKPQNWDMDPAGDMVMQGRRFPAQAKLPYPYFFHRLVRHCLLNYVNSLPSVGSIG